MACNCGFAHLIVVRTGFVGEKLVIQIHPLRTKVAQNVFHFLSDHLQEVVDGVDTPLSYADPLVDNRERIKMSGL